MLLLSPVPMVRGFGVLLVLGIGVAFACALTGGTALLVRSTGARPRGGGPLGRVGARRGRAAGARPGGRSRGWAGRSGGRRRRAARPLRRARAACSRSRCVAAAAGWALDTQTEVRSDLQTLVPQDLPAVRDLDTLQRTTGVAGELDVVVEGKRPRPTRRWSRGCTTFQ